jgi:hypothetical protein
MRIGLEMMLCDIVMYVDSVKVDIGHVEKYEDHQN